VVQTLFNQPNPARDAVPWQPNAGMTQKLSSRGYATTSWTSDAPQAFADLGYPAKLSGFSAAHYQSMPQPLTEQAQASLALLEGDERNESFGKAQPDTQQDAASNAHLPFVMDSFGSTRLSKLGVNVDAAVLQRAEAQAELAETLVVSPITSNETRPESIVIHPDVLEEVSGAELALATESVTDEADTAVEAEVEAEAEAVAVTEAPVQVQDTPAPELPAVVSGIDPEEMVQREAAQFAKGLAQGHEEAALELAEAVEKAEAQAFDKGEAQGKKDGLAKGAQQAHEEMAQEMATQRVMFENVSNELGALIQDPKKFFEPLKRLAMHIAEQVVVGELQTSSKAIERLVQRCLDELDHPVHGAVVLELNPKDKDCLQAQSGDFVKGMRLEAVQTLQRGSVRVFANDTVVEDLVEHRLEGLASALSVDVDAWQDQSPLAKRNLEVQKESEGDDVHS
jgi:flagellar biosynthesis/type III secretory pathway protein FliH